jgi:hypothetical protein
MGNGETEDAWDVWESTAALGSAPNQYRAHAIVLGLSERHRLPSRLGISAGPALPASGW